MIVMKKSLFLFLLIASTFTYANSPKNSCKVELLLSTKVYTECDFRAESLTYLKKGMKVEVVGYNKGFYEIVVNHEKAYITEANIKTNQEFESFKKHIFNNIANDEEENDHFQSPPKADTEVLASN